MQGEVNCSLVEAGRSSQNGPGFRPPSRPNGARRAPLAAHRPSAGTRKVVTKNKGEGEVEYVAEVRTDKLAALTLLARHLGIDKLTVADDRLDLTKLSTETLKRIKTELGL